MGSLYAKFASLRLVKISGLNGSWGRVWRRKFRMLEPTNANCA